MGKLPLMPNADRIRKYRTEKFRGLNHNLSAQDGEIFDMRNMTTDEYPALASRDTRRTLTFLQEPYGIFSHDDLYLAYGNKLAVFKDGILNELGTVSRSEKVFAALGDYLVIYPDKKYYNKKTGELGDLAATVSGTASVENGTYAGESAELNTITFSGVGDLTELFSEGDGVTIKITGENDISAIIREITATKLVFYENSFEKTLTANITVTREVPDLDFICTNENRLWGCKGDRIYASKLGDPFNWNVFDGISTDSWQVDVGSSGDFTACYSYRGYPCFFKEEYIYKVYGSKPANYQVMASASLGVKKGAAKSLAVAGEVLFYLSRAGVVSYSGGIPQNISTPLGKVELTNSVGGSDGRKYYLSCYEKNEESYRLYVYDTRTNMWCVENSEGVVDGTWHNGACFLGRNGALWVTAGTDLPEYAAFELEIKSYVEFGDFVENDPNKKGTGKLQLRVELEAGARLEIQIMFDSDGVWRDVSTLTTPRKRSYYLPIIPRRSDHFRIRLTGTGKWVLYSLVRENYSGSEL